MDWGAVCPERTHFERVMDGVVVVVWGCENVGPKEVWNQARIFGTRDLKLHILPGERLESWRKMANLHNHIDDERVQLKSIYLSFRGKFTRESAHWHEATPRGKIKA